MEQDNLIFVLRRLVKHKDRLAFDVLLHTKTFSEIVSIAYALAEKDN